MAENRFAKYVQQAPQAPAQNRFAKYAKPAAPVVPQTSNEAAKSNRELSWADTAVDVAKSGVTGIAQGVEGLLAIPRDLGQLAGKGVAYVADRAMGYTPEQISERQSAADARMDATSLAPSSEQLKAARESVTGPTYTPKTNAGDYARTIGEFAPAVASGPGGVARKVAMTAIPAAASETAGKLTEGSAVEPWARAITALSAGVLTSGAKTLAQNKILKSAAKSSKELQESKSQAYQLAEDTIGKQQISAPDLTKMVRNMHRTGFSAGLGGALSQTTDQLYSKSKSVLSDMTKLLRNVHKGEMPPPTYGDMEKIRQILGDVADASKDVAGKMSKDGYLATKFIDAIDDMALTSPYKDAREAYKTLRKTQRIERAIKDADTRSMSADLAYKNEFKKIVRENTRRPIFSKLEMQAIQKIAGNGNINSVLEGLGRAGFSKNSVTGPAATAALTGVFGGPPAAIATAVAATIAKKVGTKMTKNAAQQARDIVALGGKGDFEKKLLKSNADINQNRLFSLVNAVR